MKSIVVSPGEATVGQELGDFDSDNEAAYDATGPKTYVYLYEDENQLIEMRTDKSATPTGSRWRTTWAYDGVGQARVLTEHPINHNDGMRVIQERNASNTPTVSYPRGNDLSGSLEGAGGIGGLLGRSHGYSSGTWSTHKHYHADGNGNVTYLLPGIELA